MGSNHPWEAKRWGCLALWEYQEGGIVCCCCFFLFDCIINRDPLLQRTTPEQSRRLVYGVPLVKATMQGHRAPRCTTFHCKELHQLTVCCYMADPTLYHRGYILLQRSWAILAGAEVTSRSQRPTSTCQRCQCATQWCRPRESSRTRLVARLILVHIVIPLHRHRHRFQRQSLRSSRRTSTATENRNSTGQFENPLSPVATYSKHGYAGSPTS